MPPKLVAFPAAAAAVLLAAAPVSAAPGRAVKSAKHAPSPLHAAKIAPSDEGVVGLVLGMDQSSYAIPAMPQAASSHGPMIHATLTFFNYSETTLRLFIGGAPTQWQILDAQGKILWDYSVGRATPHFIRVVPLANGRLHYAQDIPLRTQDGTPLAPGRYTLRGAIPGALAATASLDFSVTR